MSLTNATRKTYYEILNGCIRAFEPNNSKATNNLSLKTFISLASEIIGNPILSKVQKYYSILHGLQDSQLQSFLLKSGDINIRTGLRILDEDFSIARDPQSELTQSLVCLKQGINTLLTSIESKAKSSKSIWSEYVRVWLPEKGKDELIDLYNRAYHASTLVAFLYLFKGESEIANRIYKQAILFFYYGLFYKSAECFDEEYPLLSGFMDSDDRKRLIGKKLKFTHSMIASSLDDEFSKQEVCNFYEERRNEEKEFLRLSKDIFNIELDYTLGSEYSIETKQSLLHTPRTGSIRYYKTILFIPWKPPICKRSYEGLYL